MCLARFGFWLSLGRADARPQLNGINANNKKRGKTIIYEQSQSQQN